jgi:mycoredoxin
MPETSVLTADATAAADHDAAVTMYSTPWCGYCRRLKSQLDQEGIAYVEVDIEGDEVAAEYVMGVNGGNQTVPTVVFPDGRTATNPSLALVKERLAA